MSNDTYPWIYASVKKPKLMKLIPWKVTSLLLSWALLGVAWNVINLKTTQVDSPTFGALLIASAAYLLATTAFLKPLTKPIK